MRIMAKSLDIAHPEKNEVVSSVEGKQSEPMVIEEPREANGLFYLIVGIIALVLAIAVSLYVYFKPDGTSTKTSTASPTSTTSESATVTTSPESTPTPSVTVSAAQATSFADAVIRVANGNGVSGEAKKIASALEAKGYKVTQANNASKQYSQTIIYYKTGNEELAEALKEAIKDQYSATVQKSDTISSNFNAVIALGPK